jgi:hypothetical protein
MVNAVLVAMGDVLYVTLTPGLIITTALVSVPEAPLVKKLVNLLI